MYSDQCHAEYMDIPKAQNHFKHKHFKFITMKKLFYLFAAILFGFTATAQNAYYAKSSMTVIVANAKKSYVKGQSYKDWSVSQIGTKVAASPTEETFFKDVYNFISTGANSESVFKNYDGKSLADLALLSKKGGAKALDAAAGNTSNRWCIPCLIKIIVDVVCEIVACDGPVIDRIP